MLAKLGIDASKAELRLEAGKAALIIKLLSLGTDIQPASMCEYKCFSIQA